MKNILLSIFLITTTISPAKAFSEWNYFGENDDYNYYVDLNSVDYTYKTFTTMAEQKSPCKNSRQTVCSITILHQLDCKGNQRTISERYFTANDDLILKRMIDGNWERYGQNSIYKKMADELCKRN